MFWSQRYGRQLIRHFSPMRPYLDQALSQEPLESGTARFQPLLVSGWCSWAVVRGGPDSLTLSGMLTSHFGSSCWAPALSIQENGQKFPFKETESLQWGDLVVSSYRAIGLVVVTSLRTCSLLTYPHSILSILPPCNLSWQLGEVGMVLSHLMSPLVSTRL